MNHIYEPLPDGSWKQHPSLHSQTAFGDVESVPERKRDLSGHWVLVSSDFVYHGAAAFSLPEELAVVLAAGRGHRSNFDNETLSHWDAFIKQHRRGMLGYPHICLRAVVALSVHVDFE